MSLSEINTHFENGLSDISVIDKKLGESLEKYYYENFSLWVSNECTKSMKPLQSIMNSRVEKLNCFKLQDKIKTFLEIIDIKAFIEIYKKNLSLSF